jgi:hypothetical protein
MKRQVGDEGTQRRPTARSLDRRATTRAPRRLGVEPLHLERFRDDPALRGTSANVECNARLSTSCDHFDFAICERARCAMTIAQDLAAARATGTTQLRNGGVASADDLERRGRPGSRHVVSGRDSRAQRRSGVDPDRRLSDCSALA